MNGNMNGTMEDSMDASSQGPPFNSVPEVDLLTMNHHTDSSNQGENSNPGEASPVHGEDSNQAEGENLPENSNHCESCSNDSAESQSPSESTESLVRHTETCANDKKNKPGHNQGIPISTTLDIYRRPSGEAQDSTSRDSNIDIDIVITVKSDELRQRCNRSNNSNLKETTNNDLEESDNVPESSTSGQDTEVNQESDTAREECGVKPKSDMKQQNEEGAKEDNRNEIDRKEERQIPPGNSYNQQSSSNSNSTQQVRSDIPRKKISFSPQTIKTTSKLLRTTINKACTEAAENSRQSGDSREDTNMEVDSTTNLEDAEDSCDSISSNSNTPANINNCTNSNDSTVESDSVASSNIKIKGDSSSDEESERDDQQDVHEIQSDSEDDDIRRVPSKQEDSEEMDTDDDSSEEEGTDGSEEGEIGNDEHVSINSDTEPEAIDDDSKDSQLLGISNRADSGEVLLVDDASNQGDQKTGIKAKIYPEVHEIVSDNDDCVLAADSIDSESRRVLEMYPGIRDKLMDVTRRLMTNAKEMMERTGQAPSSLVEECPSKKAIIVNDTKELVDLAKSKSMDKQQLSEKKEPTVVIIDTDSNLSSKTSSPVPPKSPYSTIPADSPAQALYQSIAARGTTVTPVCRAVGVAPILPSLTDDMFVVEAPSFIVPYVYEKPSIKPFREFVDVLGKELEEKRIKEEKDKLEKEKDIKVDIRKEKTEDLASLQKQEVHIKLDDGKTQVEKLDEEMSEESPKKKKSDKKGRKKRVNDDDDASWDGTSSSDSDDDVISDDEAPKTIIIKEKEDDSLDGIKDPTAADLTSDIKNSSKSDNYFDNSLGKFFINIGVNLVQEYVQSDLLKQQKRKLYKENRSGSGNVKSTEVAISSLTKNLEFSRDNNAPYKFRQKKCEYCSFKTESALAMAHHMETPHMKNNVYKCNFCTFEIRSPHDILYHMEAEHNTRGRLERAPAYHQCANCPFEDNGKGKLARHLIACAKKFKPDHNLMPPVEWEPPAKIPKMTRARHSMMNTYQAAFAKSTPAPAGLAALYRGRGRPTAPQPALPTAPRPVPGAPLVRGGLVYRPSQQLVLPTNFQLLPGGQTTIKANNNMLPAVKSLQHQPSISITPLPRALPAAPPPLAPLPAGPPGKATFVICEICDGYIKDLEQLRNHMQWIHKVKIHPKMIYNRPPLNCQKCQFRFFTDQGLERHLLGSHGLVTSSMQEAANRGKDAGRCPACGRVYQWKLLNHVARDHNMTLKPAHLSYKCTVCTATFGMYKQFENHVYSAHSVVAKRVNDKSKSVSNNHAAGPSKTSSMADSLLKPLKINDEITIIPQPAKPFKSSDKKD